MILIVDDDRAIRVALTLLLERNNYEVMRAENPAEAMEVVRNHPELELVLMDMNYTLATDGEEGLTLLKQVKVFRPDIPVILMTAWGTIDLAVQGMRNGAFDFITKPWDNGVLMDRIETALTLLGARGKEQGARAVSEHQASSCSSTIIGSSPSLLSVLSTAQRVAQTNAPVLITGESGTGKELIAQFIHEQSRRAGKPFVKVNLGGISTSLFESEMFGHKKGSFTDAKNDRTGRFELAEGGTIFLDEIGELELASQVKLLRVLQDQTYEVLGDSVTRRADVRVVCATNADLRQMVNEKTFREGEPLVEVVGTIHRGENRGTKPVILNMFYFSEPGQEITIQHPELENEQKAVIPSTVAEERLTPISKEEARIQKLVLALGKQTLPRRQIVAELNLRQKSRKVFIDNYLKPAQAKGYITYAFPAHPSLPEQAYRLTAKGLDLYVTLTISSQKDKT